MPPKPARHPGTGQKTRPRRGRPPSIGVHGVVEGRPPAGSGCVAKGVRHPEVCRGTEPWQVERGSPSRLREHTRGPMRRGARDTACPRPATATEGADRGKLERGSGEGLGGFCAEPGQVQQVSGAGLGGFSAKPDQVPEKVPGGFHSAPKSGSKGFRRRFRRRCGRLWYRARSGSTGFAAIWLTETQLRCFQRLASQHASERFVKILVATGGDTTEA